MYVYICTCTCTYILYTHKYTWPPRGRLGPMTHSPTHKKINPPTKKDRCQQGRRGAFRGHGDIPPVRVCAYVLYMYYDSIVVVVVVGRRVSIGPMPPPTYVLRTRNQPPNRYRCFLLLEEPVSIQLYQQARALIIIKMHARYPRMSLNIHTLYIGRLPLFLLTGPPLSLASKELT